MDALEYAQIKHNGQFRKDGKTPFIQHPIAVHDFLKVNFPHPEFKNVFDVAYLHDVLEDTDATEKEIETYFGETVLYMVKELTHIYDGTAFSKQKYLYRITQINDITDEYVFIIKIADRICNTLDFMKIDNKYPKIYFHKADILWGAFFAYKNMETNYPKIAEQIKQLEKQLVDIKW